MSARRKRQVNARREVVHKVIARDKICRLDPRAALPRAIRATVPPSEEMTEALRSAGPCRGALTAHEVVKRSQRRDAHLDENNCVAMCWGHNGWIEDHPKFARWLGLVESAGY